MYVIKPCINISHIYTGGQPSINPPSMCYPSLMPQQVTPRSIELQYLKDQYPHQYPPGMYVCVYAYIPIKIK